MQNKQNRNKKNSFSNPWNDIEKRLDTELSGLGSPIVLKTVKSNECLNETPEKLVSNWYQSKNWENTARLNSYQKIIKNPFEKENSVPEKSIKESLCKKTLMILL